MEEEMIQLFDSDENIPTEEPEPTTEKRKGLPWGIIGGCGLIGVIAVAFLVYAGMMQWNPKKIGAAAGEAIVSRNGDGIVNNASYIYTEDKENPIQKFVYGPLSTVFYFRRPIEEGVEYRLTDQLGRAYPLDLALKPESNAIIFQPFHEDVSAFTLSMAETGSEILSYSIEDEQYQVSARYLSEPLHILGDAVVENGVFANTGVSLQCRFAPSQIQHREITAKLMDGAYPVHASAEPMFLPVEGAVLARLDFKPIRSLQDHLVLTVKGLLDTWELNQTFETEALFDFAHIGPQTISSDNNGTQIILEGMQRQGANIVLVAHGETDTGSRTEIRINAELHGSDIKGRAVSIPGQCRSRQEGSDILFPIGENGLRLSQGSTQLLIQSIEMPAPEISLPLNPSELDDQPNADRQSVSEGIQNAFVRENAAKKEYQAQISILSLTGDQAYAYVLESWQDSGHILQARNVNAIRDGSGWKIQSDEIVSHRSVSNSAHNAA